MTTYAQIISYDKLDRAFVVRIRSTLLSQRFTVVANVIATAKSRHEHTKPILDNDNYTWELLDELKEKPMRIQLFELIEFAGKIYLNLRVDKTFQSEEEMMDEFDAKKAVDNPVIEKPELSDDEWDENVPLGVWIWLREKHPEMGVKTHSGLDALKRQRDKEGLQQCCLICNKQTDKGTVFCHGHRRGYKRWQNSRKRLIRWTARQKRIDEWASTAEDMDMKLCPLVSNYTFVKSHGDMHISYEATWNVGGEIQDTAIVEVKQVSQGSLDWEVLSVKKGGK